MKRQRTSYEQTLPYSKRIKFNGMSGSFNPIFMRNRAMLQNQLKLPPVLSWQDATKARVIVTRTQTLRITLNSRISVYIRPHSILIQLFKLVPFDLVVNIDKAYADKSFFGGSRSDLFNIQFEPRFEGYYGLHQSKCHIDYDDEGRVKGFVSLYGTFTKYPCFGLSSYRLLLPRVCLIQKPFDHILQLLRTLKTVKASHAVRYTNWFFVKDPTYIDFLDHVLDPSFRRLDTVYPSDVKSTWYVLDEYDHGCLKRLLEIEKIAAHLIETPSKKMKTLQK